MSRGLGGGRTYLRLIAHGAASRPFAAATIARLPISKAPLGIVLLVQEVTGSYGQAGTVTGAFAVGTAMGAPVWGRALDRYRQPAVMAPTAAASAAFLATLAIGSVQGLALPVLTALGWLAGVLFPPATPAMRAAWRVALRDPAHLRAAYALDAVSVETIFILGPLLLSVLLVVSPPVVPLLVTAGLLLIGGTAYSLTWAARAATAHGIAGPRADNGGFQSRFGPGPASDPAVRPVGSSAQRPARPRSLRARIDRVLPTALVPVLLTGLGMAVAFGAIDTSLAATARDVLGDQSLLGVLFAAIAGGSALSGLWFGTFDVGHRSQIRFLPLLLVAFAGGLVPLSVLLAQSAPPLLLLLPLLFLTGMAIAPTLIILQNLIDVAAPPARTNEGQAWLSTSITTGAGAGTALAGALIDAAGVSWSFAAAGSAALAASVAATVLRLRHARRTWPPPYSTSWSPP